MAPRAYGFLCGIVFLVVATIHLSRLLSRWEAFFGTWRVPHWISIPGFLLSGILCVWGFALASRRTESGKGS